MKENITTRTVNLPKSGNKVVLYDYLTTGESRSLQKKLMAYSSVDPATGTIAPVSGSALIEVQDAALPMVVKAIIVDDQEQGFDQSLIDNLAPEDGQVVYDAVQDVVNRSTLSSEAKKK